MADEFDYVIVGGGSAGAVVAARLSEDPNTSVCVLEWGPTDVGNDDVLQHPPLARPARGAARPRLHDDAAAARQRAHRPLPREGARRLLVAQHDDLVQAVAARLERLGRPGLRRAGRTTRWTRTTTASRARTGSSARRTATRSCSTGSRPRAARRSACRRTPTGTRAPFRDGVGFLDVGYDPATGVRSSSSGDVPAPDHVARRTCPSRPSRARCASRRRAAARRGATCCARPASTTDRGAPEIIVACRLDRHAAPAAATRASARAGPRAARHRRGRTTCRASART